MSGGMSNHGGHIMQRKPTALALFLGLAVSPLAFAQQSGQSDNPHQSAAASQQDTQQKNAQQAQMSAHPPVAIQTVVVAGKIDAIDRDKRTVTLRGNDGQTITIRAGEDVKDFDKLKKGQPIVARYTEAYALEMKKGSGPQQGSSSAQGQQSAQDSQQVTQSRQAQGSEPNQGSASNQTSQSQAPNAQGSQSAQQSGGSASSSTQQAQATRPVIGQVERLTVFGQVAQVDQQANRVIVQVPNGDLIRLKVNDQQAMSDLKRGDDVAVTYVQASATELKPSSESASDSAQRNDSQQSGGSQQQ